jgi:uncharacterized protein
MRTVVAVFFLSCSSAVAGDIPLEAPKPGAFVLDRANLLSEADAKKVQAICAQALKDAGVPIIVVTIESKAKYGGADLSLEVFATRLFKQWGLAKKTILLLVAKDDRKARIELEAFWGHEKDKECQEIMDEKIIPRFKKGEFSAGILSGVQGLDAMARKAMPISHLNLDKIRPRLNLRNAPPARS